jgi:DNA-binding GntR family transcriptional regulator
MADTRYAALARTLTEAVLSGRFPPDSLMPSEVELAQTYGVARGTVRSALSFLERDGLVERRRGAGTRVLQPSRQQGFGQTLDGIDGLVQYARDTRRVVRSIEPCVIDQAMAAFLGAEPGSHWIRIRNFRIEPGQDARPICFNESFVHSRLAAVTQHLSDETSAICDLIERHCGVRTQLIDQEFQAATVPGELAEDLAAAAGMPALRIIRRYSDTTGWLFEVSVSLHPSDRFSYQMQLRRSAG